VVAVRVVETPAYISRDDRSLGVLPPAAMASAYDFIDLPAAGAGESEESLSIRFVLQFSCW